MDLIDPWKFCCLLQFEHTESIIEETTVYNVAVGGSSFSSQAYLCYMGFKRMAGREGG